MLKIMVVIDIRLYPLITAKVRTPACCGWINYWLISAQPLVFFAHKKQESATSHNPSHASPNRDIDCLSFFNRQL